MPAKKAIAGSLAATSGFVPEDPSLPVEASQAATLPGPPAKVAAHVAPGSPFSSQAKSIALLVEVSDDSLVLQPATMAVAGERAQALLATLSPVQVLF